MRTKFVILICVVSILIGCASMQANQQRETIKEIMDLIYEQGRDNKEDIIMLFGAPTEVQQIDDIEVYIYLTVYDSKKDVVVNPTYFGVTTATSRTRVRYDLIRMYFREDKLIKWDCIVQR